MTPPVPPTPAPAPLWRRALPPVLAAALVGGLGWALLRPAGTEAGGSALVGQPAPPFALSALSGETVSLQAYRGRPVVLNFWASWCEPCRREAPLFAELARRPGGPAVIGVLFNETNEPGARTFIQQYGLNYPHLRDPGAGAAIAYTVTGIPQTVFIDQAGVVRGVDRGELDRAQLNRGLQSLGVPGL